MSQPLRSRVRRDWSIRDWSVPILAAIAYIPFFLSSPGEVSADTKAYLYLNPGRLLASAANIKPRSLRLHGDTLSWQAGGHNSSATL